LLASDDHQVNPGLLNKALLKANENSGTQFISQPGSLEFEQTAGVTSGVLLENHTLYDRIESPWVVAADGAWSHEIEPLKKLPLRPVRGQYVRLQGQGLIKHVVRTPDVYMIPRDNGVLYLGASMEEAGFDATPLAGHTMEMLWHAFRAVPGIYELEILETAVGFRPALRDNLPAIGPTEVPGLLAAFGHYRHGMMLAPITAAAILEILQSNRIPPILNALSPMRFNDESPP
jgi:glycine oxidase